MLCGADVGLRAIEREDLAQLLAWRNKPHFRRYFREYRELSMANQQHWYEQIVLSDPAVRMFSIVSLNDDALLGACGLCYIDWVRRSADFSIYIGHDDLYVDDNLAADAAQVMRRYAFDELNLHRLWAEVYAYDERKIALFESLGFSIDGRFRDNHFDDGRWHDSLFYSQLSTDEGAHVSPPPGSPGGT